jgi:type VI secretion system protein ImpK
MAGSNAGEKRRLVDLFSDLFILGAHLKTARDYGTPDALRIRLVEMFNAAEREAKRLAISDDALQQARYAVAAFLDEMILGVPSPHRDAWSARPLQYEFFREHVAGVEFFNRLDGLRRSISANRDIVEVYYLCLALGFEGQYKLHGREKLKDLIDGLARELQPRGGEMPLLSPHGKRPDELIEMVKQGIPSWVVAVSCFAIVFLLYLSLSLLVSRDANRISHEIQQLIGGGQ